MPCSSLAIFSRRAAPLSHHLLRRTLSSRAAPPPGLLIAAAVPPTLIPNAPATSPPTPRTHRPHQRHRPRLPRQALALSRTSAAPLFSASSSPRTMASAAAKRLSGKTILITGASAGLGRATALEFARTNPNGGLRLIITARRVEALRDLAGEIERETGRGVEVLPVQLDVTDAAAVRGFVESLPAAWRNIDVLVNNAGLALGLDRAPNIKEHDINTVLATNVTGLVNMTQAILPIFLERPDGGQGDIINIGSVAGRDPYPGGSIYCASKAAVQAFTDSIRKELINTRIRVLLIDIGQLETEFSLVRFGGDKAKADAVYAGCEPLTPTDVAELIVFNATRRENVVVADSLIFPNHQASATFLHRKSS